MEGSQLVTHLIHVVEESSGETVLKFEVSKRPDLVAALRISDAKQVHFKR